MQEYEFTLIVDGIDYDDFEDASNRLYEAGCSDGTVGMRNNIAYIDFDRESSSRREAIISAIKNVHSAGYKVARVEPDDLVTAADISKRSGRSREGVRLLIGGKRRDGRFPPPIAKLTAKSPVWRWSDVVAWFAMQEGSTLNKSEVDDAITTAAINDALSLSRHTKVEFFKIYKMFVLQSKSPKGKKVVVVRRTAKNKVSEVIE